METHEHVLDDEGRLACAERLSFWQRLDAAQRELEDEKARALVRTRLRQLFDEEKLVRAAQALQESFGAMPECLR